MFYGQYRFINAENNRIQIPVAFQELHASRVVFTQGFDRNLLILSVDVFEALARLVMSLNIADPLARSLQRILLGNAVYCEIDPKGWFELPVTLREFAGITADGVLVGQGKYLEAWSAASWQHQELTLLDAEANAQRFTSLNLAGL
jgi:MraZ protein